MNKGTRSDEDGNDPPPAQNHPWSAEEYVGSGERDEAVLVNVEEDGDEEAKGEGLGGLLGTDSENRGGNVHNADEDAWAYRVEMAIREERIMQLEKWKQDKMTTVQYIWAELGAKHVKLGQEQEQLEKLTKLIEKETQEVEALKCKYQHEDFAISPLFCSNRDIPKDSDVGQVGAATPRQQLNPLSPVKRGRGRPRKSLTNKSMSPGSTGKRKRGRPKKIDSTPKAQPSAVKSVVDTSTVKRPRGRPRKYPRPVT